MKKDPSIKPKVQELIGRWIELQKRFSELYQAEKKQALLALEKEDPVQLFAPFARLGEFLLEEKEIRRKIAELRERRWRSKQARACLEAIGKALAWTETRGRKAQKLGRYGLSLSSNANAVAVSAALKRIKRRFSEEASKQGEAEAYRIAAGKFLEDGRMKNGARSLAVILKSTTLRSHPAVKPHLKTPDTLQQNRKKL